MALSQLLQANVVSKNEIVFSSTDGTNNTASSNYAKYDSSSQTLIISESATSPTQVIPKDSILKLKNEAKSTPPSSDESYEWWIGLDNLTSSSEVKNFDIDTPTSTLILVSLPEARGAKSISLGEGSGSLKIKAKEIQIGDGTQTYTNLFACSSGGGGGCPAQMYVLSQDSSIEGNVVVNKDGVLVIGNMYNPNTQTNSLTNFTLQGDLEIKGGGLAIASMGGGENPTFDVNGTVRIENGHFQTFIPTSGNAMMGDLRIVSASRGITMSGVNAVHGALSYFLQDFVSIDQSHKDYGWAYQSSIDLYEYSLRIEGGNTLYATPKLTESAKQQGVVELINDAKNSIALGFYKIIKEQNRDQEVENALFAYLQSQGINPLGARTISMRSTKASSISTTGFDNIDAKLSVIKEGVNNTLAESIKNSSNNLLAVNFVNTMMQGYNNTPIQLLNEVKSNLSTTASLSSFLRNDLHTTLALASRFASFSFAPKINQTNSLAQSSLSNALDSKEALSQENPSNALDSLNSFNPNLSNSLWANAFGGANLIGSSVGASYGLNLGYDKNLGNALLGAYLSYEYATLSPSLLTLNSHNIKLGIYSRVQKQSNEIDLELSSLLSLLSQESSTKALDSKSKANYLSSLTEFKATYGYAFLQGDFKLKPLLGISLGFSYTPSFKESGDIIKDFSSFNNFNANLQAGLEFRANFSNKGFLYTLLSIEQDLYNSLNSLTINSQSLSLTQPLKTYAQILLGGEIVINQDWNIALSLGAKQSIVGSKDYEDKTINETYINGSVGVGYRF